MEPEILYEDSQVLVINKPTGMVVNRAVSVKGEAVQDWTEEYLKILNPKYETLNKSQIENSNFPKSLEFSRQWRASSLTGNSKLEFAQRAGIVHRLDKETSGCLIIAKNLETFTELQRQFKAREVEKTYLALVHGKVEPASGTISAPIGRLPWNRERFGVLPGGREAETLYKVISTFKVENVGTKHITPAYYSLVEFYPRTGRTHQIRVHAKHLHHPLVSDNFYAGRKTSRRDREWCLRLFLHASKISFIHPETKKRIMVEAPLPEDLKSALKALGV